MATQGIDKAIYGKACGCGNFPSVRIKKEWSNDDGHDENEQSCPACYINPTHTPGTPGEG